MTRTEINERIEELENRLFLLDMIDRQTEEERWAVYRNRLELIELRAQLKAQN